jgi:cytochrome b561
MFRSDKYHGLLRLLHWVMAIAIIGILCCGFYMTGLTDKDPQKWVLYDLHKSVGMILLLFVTLRLLIRLSTYLPPLPGSFGRKTKMASIWSHRLLYLLMFAVPLSGYLMSNYGGYPVAVFGLKLPVWLHVNKMLAGLYHTVHVKLPYVLIAIITLHVLATFKHYFIDRVNILKRMW